MLIFLSIRKALHVQVAVFKRNFEAPRFYGTCSHSAESLVLLAAEIVFALLGLSSVEQDVDSRCVIIAELFHHGCDTVFKQVMQLSRVVFETEIRASPLLQDLHLALRSEEVLVKNGRLYFLLEIERLDEAPQLVLFQKFQDESEVRLLSVILASANHKWTLKTRGYD